MKALTLACLATFILSCNINPLGTQPVSRLPEKCGLVEDAGMAMHPIDSIMRPVERFWVCEDMGRNYWAVRSCLFETGTRTPQEGRFLCRTLQGWNPWNDPADSVTVWKKG